MFAKFMQTAAAVAILATPALAAPDTITLAMVLEPPNLDPTGGAAAAIATARMIMLAKLPVRLRLLVPAVENAVSGNAFRPGDVLGVLTAEAPGARTFTREQAQAVGIRAFDAHFNGAIAGRAEHHAFRAGVYLRVVARNIAINMLRQGGNAVDAAIATAMALNADATEKVISVQEMHAQIKK